MPASIRFRPPPLAISPEIRWMLLRAFGPVGLAEAPAPAPEPAAALALARRFEVSARIAARQGRERLAAEMGEEAAAGFAHDRRAAAAVGMRLMGEVRRVAATAAALDIPLALLKFAALEATGLLAPGSRDACDVDLLAPGPRARELWEALVAAGFRGSGLPQAEHQLPALVWPEGGAVEIHLHLPGVRLEERAAARHETLARLGMLHPLPELPGRCAAPPPEVLAAHVLVHGLGQHGWWPGSYSLLKMVADLLDLGAAAPDPLGGRALAWVARDVSPVETAAVRRLTGRLAAGEDPTGWQGPEETLLRHMLAGRLDAGYEQSLRLGLFRPQPSERARPVQLARAVLAATLLSDAQVAAVYGVPRRRLGYLGRRLARPFDLLWRLAVYGVRWARVRMPRGPRRYTPPP
jgi:hypothetical protein